VPQPHEFLKRPYIGDGTLAQLAFVLLLSPLFAGILTRCREIVQSKRGPAIWQPYRDLRKLFSKEERRPSESSWIFGFTPYVVFVVPLIVRF
jgi:formate hydrogenlyase subunit 4